MGMGMMNPMMMNPYMGMGMMNPMMNPYMGMMMGQMPGGGMPGGQQGGAAASEFMGMPSKHSAFHGAKARPDNFHTNLIQEEAKSFKGHTQQKKASSPARQAARPEQ